MKGDVLVVEQQHRRAAAEIAQAVERALAHEDRPYVVALAGESGCGKSEMASALADRLLEAGFRSVILGQDDYFVLPPRSNDARRRADPDWLGPHVEVRMDILQANVDAVRDGATAIEKPVVDYDGDAVSREMLNLDGVRVVIVEGTYVSLLRHVDCRVFIDRSHIETLEHRRKRNRGGEARDPFVESLLATEHKIIAGHRQLADFVVSRDFGVVPVD